jgi:HD-GYP domain-containing protein (c-di-GMP phosphodiesterase class II)
MNCTPLVRQYDMTKAEAIEEIRRNSDTQFDSDISQLFLNIISEELTVGIAS